VLVDVGSEANLIEIPMRLSCFGWFVRFLLPLALVACGGGGGAGVTPAAGSASTVQVVVDTATGGDCLVQFQVAAAQLASADGTRTGNLLREPQLVTWSDPSGEVSGLQLLGVPRGEYAALHLLLVPGSGAALAADGGVRPLGYAGTELTVPIADGLQHADPGSSWIVLGHNAAPDVIVEAGGLRWVPEFAGRTDDGPVELAGLRPLVVQNGGVTASMPAAGDALLRIEFAPDCTFGDDQSNSYGGRGDFLAGLSQADELRVRGELGRDRRCLVRHARRGRGSDGPRLLGRILELRPAATSFVMRVQAEVRRGERRLLATPVEVVVRCAQARLQRPDSRVRLAFEDLAVGQLAKVKWTSRTVENGVTIVVAREVEVTSGPGEPMQPEWQGRVQSVDVAAGRIVVVPRNDDPIVIGGVSVPEVVVLVDGDTVLQRRERQGPGRFAIELGDIVAGEDRIWFRGRVTGPATVDAVWVRVRQE
jgi:hypothetical protein